MYFEKILFSPLHAAAYFNTEIFPTVILIGSNADGFHKPFACRKY